MGCQNGGIYVSTIVSCDVVFAAPKALANVNISQEKDIITVEWMEAMKEVNLISHCTSHASATCVCVCMCVHVCCMYAGAD